MSFSNDPDVRASYLVVDDYAEATIYVDGPSGLQPLGELPSGVISDGGLELDPSTYSVYAAARHLIADHLGPFVRLEEGEYIPAYLIKAWGSWFLDQEVPFLCFQSEKPENRAAVFAFTSTQHANNAWRKDMRTVQSNGKEVGIREMKAANKRLNAEDISKAKRSKDRHAFANEVVIYPLVVPILVEDTLSPEGVKLINKFRSDAEFSTRLDSIERGLQENMTLVLQLDPDRTAYYSKVIVDITLLAMYRAFSMANAIEADNQWGIFRSYEGFVRLKFSEHFHTSLAFVLKSAEEESKTPQPGGLERITAGARKMLGAFIEALD